MTPPEVSAGPQGVLRVDGLAIRYRARGDGVPVLLLHGAALGSSLDAWGPVHDPLAARGLRVVAYDQPGFGESDASPDHSAAYRRRFVLRVMDALGIGAAVLVGHSQSGGFAVRLALEDPARVHRVVVVGTASLLPPLEGTRAQDAEEGVAREPSLEEARALLERQVADRLRVTAEAVALRHRLSVGPSFAAHLARERARAERREEGPALGERLGGLKVPALFLYGALDRDAARRAPLLRERHPALDVHVLEDCGHLLHWDAPEAFVALVSEFASRASASRVV